MSPSRIGMASAIFWERRPISPAVIQFLFRSYHRNFFFLTKTNTARPFTPGAVNIIPRIPSFRLRFARRRIRPAQQVVRLRRRGDRRPGYVRQGILQYELVRIAQFEHLILIIVVVRRIIGIRKPSA